VHFHAGITHLLPFELVRRRVAAAASCLFDNKVISHNRKVLLHPDECMCSQGLLAAGRGMRGLENSLADQSISRSEMGGPLLSFFLSFLLTAR
jgi:hypothetical protein